MCSNKCVNNVFGIFKIKNYGSQPITLLTRHGGNRRTDPTDKHHYQFHYIDRENERTQSGLSALNARDSAEEVERYFSTICCIIDTIWDSENCLLNTLINAYKIYIIL